MTSAIPAFAATYRAPQPPKRKPRRLGLILAGVGLAAFAAVYAIGAAVGPQTPPASHGPLLNPPCARAMDHDAAGRRLADGLAAGDLETGDVDGACVILPKAS